MEKSGECICTGILASRSVSDLDTFHTIAVYFSPPPGIFARWIWSFQHCLYSCMVSIDGNLVAIEMWDEVIHCPHRQGSLLALLSSSFAQPPSMSDLQMRRGAGHHPPDSEPKSLPRLTH